MNEILKCASPQAVDECGCDKVTKNAGGGSFVWCKTPNEADASRNASKSLRIEWIDAAKGLGIILVILGHTHALFRPYIYSFHMPLFFLLSGFLGNNAHMKPTAFLIKKIRTLLLPYLFFSVVSLLINAFVMNAEVALDLFLREVLTASRTGLSINPTLWFLPCLFTMEVMIYCLQKALRYPVLVYLAVIGLSVSAFASVSKVQLPFSVNDAAYNLIYYIIGRGVKRMDMDRAAEQIFTGMCFIFTLFLFVNPSIYADIFQKIPQNYLGKYAGTVLLAMIGILGTIYLSNVLKNCVVLKFWGKNSLIIFATHIFILNGMYYLLTALGLTVNQGYHIYSACTTVICLAIMTPVIDFFNNHFSLYLGKTHQKMI